MEPLFKEETGGIIQFREQLTELIRARTPLIYLGTIEVKRSLEEIRIVSSEVGADLQIFNLASGLLTAGREKTNTDPIGVLDIILNHAKKSTLEKQTVWAIPLFHLLLRQSEALILSRLRDFIEFNKFMDTVIITGSSGFTLPPELSDVPAIDFPLPNRQEIRALLDCSLAEKNKDRIEKAFLGLERHEIENLIARSLVRKGGIEIETIESLREELLQKRANDCLEIHFPKESLDQVGGMETFKQWLEQRKSAFFDAEALQQWNLPPPKGILLTGVPGCGKSLVCKAIAGSWGLPLLHLDPSRIYSSSLGASEKNLHDSLRVARSVSPCILWVDEIEKGFSPTDSQTDGGVSRRVLGAFLHFLQERSSPVFVAATSNDLSSLPPEMLRKGRWDEIFFIDLPSTKERQSIFKALLQKYRCPLEVDDDLVSFSEGYSGAEIEQAIIAAAYDALFRKSAIHLFDIKRTLRAIIPLSASMKERIENLRIWGHAVARPVTHGRNLNAHAGNVLSFTPKVGEPA
jgi:ATP-dependent 26S proteasome regulatory subunit